MKRGLSDVDSGAVSQSSSSHVDAALAGCVSKGVLVGVPKLPWELTPHLEAMFNPDPAPWLSGPKIPKNFPAIPQASVPATGPKIREMKKTVQKLCYKAAKKQADVV